MFKNKSKEKLHVITDLKDIADDKVQTNQNAIKELLLAIAGRTPNDRSLRLTLLATALSVLLEKDPKKVKRMIRRERLARIFKNKR